MWVVQIKLFRMSINDLLSTIDAEISSLQQARKLLTGEGTPKRAKRKLSPEARKHVGDAQRKRWKAAKKQKKVSVVVA
jgi:hypothetical protein